MAAWEGAWEGDCDVVMISTGYRYFRIYFQGIYEVFLGTHER